MALNLAELKKFASARRKDLELWDSAEEAIEMIETNKQFLKVADQKKREFEGNTVAVADLSNQLGNLGAEIGKKRAELSRLTNAIDTDLGVIKKKKEHELDQYLSDRRVEFEKTLDGVKKETKDELIVLKKIKEEKADTIAELNTIRSSIAGVLG